MSRVYQALKKAERERMEAEVTGQRESPEVKKHFPGNLSIDQHLVTLLNPKSSATEQFRKLRTSIMEHSDSNPPRCILITSSVSGEGKTVTAVNLAISLAQGVHEHVLLMDADLRKPVLHKCLGLNPVSGLSDYLTSDIELSDILVKTPVPKLTLLPAGPASDKPSELFSSVKMRNLIMEVRSRYEDRYIIIDSTPIMATSEPDILSRQVDGVILVVKAGKTPREVIQRSLLNLDRNKILGVVFNDVDFPTSGYRYGYHPYYSYYSYYDDEKKK